MKKQVNKNKLEKPVKIDISERTKVLKWVIIALGIAIAIGWIGWFACDCIFISKGIHFDLTEIWNWDTQWYGIVNKLGVIVLSLLGGYIVLILSYMVICGLNVKSNIKFYIYQLIVSAISFIAITICIIKAASMMVNEQWVIDVTMSLPIKFEVYHLDFLTWMCIPFGFVIFTNTLMLCSFRAFGKHTIIKDTNILLIILAFASVILFVPFVLSLGYNDPFIGGAETILEWKELIESSITWKHVVCQCVTSPMGIFAGMTMILLVIRLITVMFVYNQKWGEKKAHIIIFSVITFFTFASFIVAHATKLDFEKLINDYNSLKLGCLLVVIAQTVSCLAAGIYSSISCHNYSKKSL